MFQQQYRNNIRTVSGTVTLYPDDNVLNCDTSAGPVTINLDAIVANAWSTQYMLLIADYSNNAGTNNITVNAPAGYYVNGASSVSIAANGGMLAISIINNTNYLADSSNGFGALTYLLVYNTVYVMKNGNDSTGLVQRFDKPFLTIAAARSAALAAFTSRSDTARVKIVVESGYWEEDIILDTFIDYDLGNSVVNGEITDNFVDFGSSGANVWTNIIYGPAKIYNQDTLASGHRTHAMQIYKPNTKLLIYAAVLASKYDNAVAVTNGRVKIVGPVKIYTEELTAAYAVPLELTQDGAGSDFTASLVEVYYGDIFNLADAHCPPISFSYGGASKNQTLSLINCRVKNASTAGTSGNDAAIAVGNQIASNGKLNMYGTVLYAASGANIYVESACTLVFYNYPGNIVNRAAVVNGTLTNALSIAQIVNAAVEAGF